MTTINIAFTEESGYSEYNDNYIVGTNALGKKELTNETYTFTEGTDSNGFKYYNGDFSFYANGSNKILYSLNIMTGFQEIGSYTGGDNTTLECFTDTCDILTKDGYKNIKDLNIGDMVLTQDNRQVPILDKVEFTKIDKPVLIKKDHFGENLPNKDTYISNEHAYKVNGQWKINCFDNDLEKNWDSLTVKYYHIKLPNYYTDKLVVNGIEMESWYGNERNKRNTGWKKLDGELVMVNKETNEKINF